jgi:predicted solute-binding protein
VKLLLHDALATAPLVYPLQAGWAESGLEIELRPSLFAADVDAATAALVPSAEIALLHETHVVVPEVAVIAEQSGTIAMRVPVRPDEVERSPIRLYEASGTAEILARATVEPFYGIVPSEWTRDERADAQVVIVEGSEALMPPEAGFSEDLVRAWFIMTGQPLVSHLLVVPKSVDPGQVRDVMVEARRLGHERRRDVRKATAERFGVDRERITELGQASRYALEESDRRAMMMLLQRGNRGSAYPYAWQISFAGDPEGTEPTESK